MYWDVLYNDNQRKYAYFNFSIKWKVSDITKSISSNGYIVQKVTCTNSSSISGIELEPYYEAWKVINGKCIKATACEPDDVFEWGSLSFIQLQIGNSLGKSGEIIYKTQVYWIDERDSLYKTVDLWKEGTVYAAGNLKSCYVVDCCAFDSKRPVFVRPDFIHYVDFTDSEIIKKALIELRDEIPSTENFKSLVKGILEGTNYEFLLTEIQ
jgi:hypothetical protein